MTPSKLASIKLAQHAAMQRVLTMLRDRSKDEVRQWAMGNAEHGSEKGNMAIGQALSGMLFNIVEFSGRNVEQYLLDLLVDELYRQANPEQQAIVE